MGNFEKIQSPTSGIQEAVDRLPACGGTVCLPSGEYLLRRRIILRSNVTLRGSGTTTVLTRPPAGKFPLKKAVTSPEAPVVTDPVPGLRQGDEMFISDNSNWGWRSRHVIVRRIEGSTEFAGDILVGDAKWDYRPERGGFAANWFPALWLKDIENVAVEDLVIDGCIGVHDGPQADFVVAAVHALQCRNVRITGLIVRNWPGDGIGIQDGNTALVSGCLVENCRGHGLHPGTALRDSIWTGNSSRQNTRDGCFVCLAVTHASITGNLFIRNGGHGIGGLADPDRYNVISGNVCAENGQHGIQGERAVGNVIQGNLCRNNSQSEAGRFAGIFLSAHRDNVVTGNFCVDDQPVPTQKDGLVESSPAGENIVANNHCPPPGR